MDYLDILVFSVMAVFVFVRLWSVLGGRHDDEPQKQNPFATKTPQNQDEEGVVVMPEGTRPQEIQPLLSARVAPTSLAGVLEQVRVLDPEFDEKRFIHGAKMAFERIVNGFAKGDLAHIEKWLAPEVSDSFQKAISKRQEARQTLESRLDRIAEADIISARLEGTRAFLTVSFSSYQENVTRDAFGATISGSPGQVEEIRDVWTFARDLKSDDPNWLLVETRS